MLIQRRIKIFTFLLLLSAAVSAQEEKTISAAIYNFTRFVEWPPEDASGNFIIDVIGHKSVYDKLKEITAGKTVGKQNIEVRYLENINGITKSHILFLGFWQSKDIATVNSKISSSHTLLITEKDGLIDGGSGINFVIRAGAIKFEIKRANIQKYKLEVSTELEKMAEKAY
jgi:hypothetical protein